MLLRIVIRINIVRCISVNKIEITVLSARVLDALSGRGLKAKTVHEFERYGTRRIVKHCLGKGQILYTLTTGCQQGTVEVRPVKNPIKSDLARNTERTGKPGAPMHTLTTKDRHGVLYEGRIRRLTPRECLRLQGWADDRIDTVLAIQSDNQAYKQAGNGVTVNVVEAIGRRIAKMDAELRGEALAP